jgi:hypothetical protein
LKAIKEAPEEIYYGSATDSLFAFNWRELLLSQEVLNNCYCENNDLDKTICERECDAPTVIKRSDLTQRELSVDDLTSSYSTIQWPISLEINQRKVFNELLLVRNKKVYVVPPTDWNALAKQFAEMGIT